MKASEISPEKIVDSVLEATIIGSFTKIGYRVRKSLFDWDTVGSPVDSEMSAVGKTVVITGGTSGIGKAIASGLVDLGATVHLTSRDVERARQSAAEIERDSTASSGAATGHSLDTGSFESIDAFVRELDESGVRPDVLINNAGALTDEYASDDYGTELTLSTHLIGPYYLTTQMKPLLNTGAVVLFMSSGGMYTQELDVDRIELSARNYKGAIAYARAKRGQVEMVEYLAPRWAPDIMLHSMHPGWVDTDGVDAGLPGFSKVMGPLLRPAHEGADTAIWLAATGGGDAEPGQFWLDRRPRRTTYVPGTGTDHAERSKLIDWLDAEVSRRISAQARTQS